MDGGHLVMEDLRNVDTVNPDNAVAVTWNTISTGGAACVSFSGLFAEAEAGDNKPDIDTSDYIHVDYSIDNGVTWVPLLHFEGAAFTSSTSNGFFHPDLDFDGEGDVSERALNGTAWSYSAVSQPLNGASVLSLRLSVQVNAGDEDAGFDTFALAASSCSAATPTGGVTTTVAASPTTVAASPTTVAASSTTVPTTATTSAASTTAAAIVLSLSLPLLEPFNNRSQMTLSHNFGGDKENYFGISNGDQSDFGTGSASPEAYEGRWARCS